MTDSQVQAAIDAGATAGDVSTLEKFKRASVEFTQERGGLQRLGAQVARFNDYDMSIAYARLVERADTIQNTIGRATSAFDEAVRWTRDVLGLGSVQALGTLGIAPAVWVGVVAASATATAIIGKWLLDARSFARNVSERRRIEEQLIASGTPPDQAIVEAARLAPVEQPGFGAAIKSTGTFLVVGILVVWIVSRMAKG